jgi:hypothetical protein
MIRSIRKTTRRPTELPGIVEDVQTVQIDIFSLHLVWNLKEIISEVTEYGLRIDGNLIISARSFGWNSERMRISIVMGTAITTVIANIDISALIGATDLEVQMAGGGHRTDFGSLSMDVKHGLIANE